MSEIIRNDWEVFLDGNLSDGTETMWIRHIKNSNVFYLIEECVNGTFNVLNQNEEFLSNHKTLHSAKISVGNKIKKLKSKTIGNN